MRTVGKDELLKVGTEARMVQRRRRTRRFSSLTDDDLDDFLPAANRICWLAPVLAGTSVPSGATVSWFVRRRCIGSRWRSAIAHTRSLQYLADKTSLPCKRDFLGGAGWLR